MSRVRWQKRPRLAWNAAAYRNVVQGAVVRQMEYWAPVIEGAAKDEADWTDRTGNARQGLKGRVEEEAFIVRLILMHTMDYGIYLELSNGAKYAIILPTLENHYDPIFQSVRAILR